MTKMPVKINQNASPNNNSPLIVVPGNAPDGLRVWMKWYFEHAVTTSPNSQKEQRRDIESFITFMEKVEKTDARIRWTPRLSEAYKEHMRSVIRTDGQRLWSDRTINRTIVHLKTFAKWVHGLRVFPLGNPMKKIKSISVTNSLEVERAIEESERRRILDAADYLLQIGGRSKSRRRYAKASVERAGQRPCRKGYRAWRNRAIVYTLIETGMRRKAVTMINEIDVDARHNKIIVEEKGGARHTYSISREGMAAILAYVEHERQGDNAKWNSPALFLAAKTIALGTGRLSTRTINQIWDDICTTAGVAGKTPHCARHAMGVHLMKKFGNVAAVQRQLGHKNAAYSIQYARVTSDELQDALNDR